MTKKIHGRFYDYWQRTKRQGKSVRTFNIYIGPTTTLKAPIAGWQHMSQSSRHNARNDRTFHDAMYWKKAYGVLRAKTHPKEAPPGCSCENCTQTPPKNFYRTVGNVVHTFPVKQLADSKYYVMMPNNTEPWIEKGFDTPEKAADNAQRHQANYEVERTAEAAAEDEYFYHHHATPEQREHIEAVRPYLRNVPPQKDRPATTPNDAMWKLDPFHNPDGVDLRRAKKAEQLRIWDDESVKYGSVKQRKQRLEAAVRKAKRETRGIKKLNPFIAKGIKKKLDGPAH